MFGVITVADEVLRIAKAKGKSLTPLQLMKLVYIAHGWHLAIRNSDLFSERIEAWKYGPIIPDLYQATKHFGNNPIPLELITGNSIVDTKTSSFLKEVVDQYGNLSGVHLSSITHGSRTPWQQVYRDDIQGIEILDSLIKTHYKELLSVQQKRAA